MSLSSTISQCCTGFGSRVIKKRTESVNQLKELLSIESNISSIDQETWEHIVLEFMALIEMEQRDFLKKLGPASLATATVPTRFKQLGTDFRWILKVCHNNATQPLCRIIREVYSHIIAILWLNRESFSDEQPFKNSSFAPDATRKNLEVFTPFLLDYSKALANHILIHRPYRDRLTKTLWDNLIYLFGSTLIGEKSLTGSQNDSGNSNLPDTRISYSRSRRSQSIDISSDETDVESDVESPTSVDNSKENNLLKSKFSAYTNISPQKPRSRYQSKVGTQQLGTNLAEVEVAKIICLLVASTYGWIREYGFNTLCLLLTYFYCYPRETNTTPLILSAVNSVICELTLNDVDVSCEFSLLFHNIVVSLWSTKTLAVKVELICFVRLQFKQIYTCLDPYVLSESQLNTYTLSEDTLNRLYDIYRCIQDDLAKSRNESVNPLLGRAYSFNFTSLLSTAPSTGNKSHPVAQTNESLGLTFGTHTPFRSKSNENHVYTWAMKSSDDQVGWRWVCMDFIADVYNQLILVEQWKWCLEKSSRVWSETKSFSKSCLPSITPTTVQLPKANRKRNIREEFIANKRTRNDVSASDTFPVLCEIVKTLSLSSSNNNGLLISLLQVFMSLNEKYPHRILSIPTSLMMHISSAFPNRNTRSFPELVIELLSSEDHTTLFWSLLCLKTFAESSLTFSKWTCHKKSQSIEPSQYSFDLVDLHDFWSNSSQMWSKVWHQALQKVTSLYVGGAAVLVLNTLMISQLVPISEMAASRKEISNFVPVLLSQNLTEEDPEIEGSEPMKQKDFTDNLIILLTNYSALVSFDIFSHNLDSSSSKQARDVSWLRWIYAHMIGRSKSVSDAQLLEDGLQTLQVSSINDIEMYAEALIVPFLQTHTEHQSDSVDLDSLESCGLDSELYRDIFIENHLKIQGYQRMGQLREIASTDVMFEKRLRDVTALRELLDEGPLNVIGIHKTSDHWETGKDVSNYRPDLRQKLCHELCNLFFKTFSDIHNQVRKFSRLIRDPDMVTDSLYAHLCRNLISSIQISTLFNRVAEVLVNMDVTTFELLLKEPLIDEMNTLWSLLHQAIRLLSNQTQYLSTIIQVLKTHFEVKYVEAYPERQVWQRVVQPELRASSTYEPIEHLWKFQLTSPTLLQYICNCLIEISLLEELPTNSTSETMEFPKKPNSMDFEDEFVKTDNSTKSGPALVTTNPSLEYYGTHSVPLRRKLSLDALRILLHIQVSLFSHMQRTSLFSGQSGQWKLIHDMILKHLRHVVGTNSDDKDPVEIASLVCDWIEGFKPSIIPVVINKSLAHELCELCSRVLVDVRYQKDQIAYIAVLRFLRLLTPAMIPSINLMEENPQPEDEAIVESLEKFFGWFVRQWRKNMLWWKVRLELCGFTMAFLESNGKNELLNQDGYTPRSLVFQMLEDEDFTVRVYCSRRITWFFQGKELSVNHTECNVTLTKNIRQKTSSRLFETVKSHVLSHPKVYEHSLTRLIAVSNVCTICPEIRKTGIYHLIESGTGIHNSNYCQVIARTLGSISCHLKYGPKAQNLLFEFLPFIISKWIKSNDILEFPFNIFGYKSFRDFCSDVRNELVAQLVLMNDRDTISLIATSLNVEIPELLKSCFDRIFGYILPLLYSENPGSFTKILDGYLRQVFEPEQFNFEFRRNIEAIILNLLSIVNDDLTSSNLPRSNEVLVRCEKLKPKRIHCQLELCSLNRDEITIYNCITYIADLLKVEVQAILTPARMYKILLGLRRFVESTKMVLEKKRLLGAYRLLISLTPEHIQQPLILRELILTFSNLIRTPELYEDSFEILVFVRDQVLSYKSPELALNVFMLINSLTQCCHDMDHAISESKCSECQIPYNLADRIKPLIDFLHRCMVSNVLYSLSYIEDSDGALYPFPEEDIFRDLSKISEEYYLGFSNLQLLQMYQNIWQCVHPAPLIAGLKHIRRILHNTSPTTLKQPEYLSVIQSLISALFKVCSGTYPSAYQNQILLESCRCIGQLAPYNVQGYALQTNMSRIRYLSKQIISREDSDILLRIKASILTCLSDLLTNSDILTVQITAKTLKYILATPSGVDSFSLVSEYNRRILESFYPRSNRKSKIFRQVEKIYPNLEDNELWKIALNDHRKWVKYLACSLISHEVQDEFLVQLGSVCENSYDFSENIIPYLIYNILDDELKQGPGRVRALLSDKIIGMANKLDKSQTQTLTTILDIVIFLRKQKIPHGRNPFENNFWLDLNYLELAEIAQKCGNFSISLIFVEVWYDVQKNNKPPNDSDVSKVNQLLLNAYKYQDEPDGFYGVKLPSQANSFIKKYEHEGRWLKSLSVREEMFMENSQSNSQTHMGILESLRHLGYNHLMNVYLKGLSLEVDQFDNKILDLRYENAWRSNNWEVESMSLEQSTEEIASQQLLYHGLHAIRNGIKSKVHQVVTTALLETTAAVQQGTHAQGVHSGLLSIIQFLEIEEGGLILESTRDCSNLLSIWKARLEALLLNSEFSDIEQLLALRTATLSNLIKSLGTLSSTSSSTLQTLNNHLSDHILHYASMARKAKQFQLAANAISQHKFIFKDTKDNFADQCHVKIALEECKLLWAQKEHSAAIDSLQILINHVSTNSLNIAKEALNQKMVDMLRRAGKWMASLRVDQPQNILDKYLKKAVDFIEEQSLFESVGGRAFFDLAKYVDEQYQAMLNSQAFATSQALFKHKEKELEACQFVLSKMSSKEKSSQPMYLVQMRKLQVQVDMDRQKIQRALNDRLEYLLIAIEHYLKCLTYDDQFDMSIFRLCSLWFQNANQIDANSLIAQYTPRLQTRKFIPLIYQLAARMSCDSRELRYIEQDPFQIALIKLIERMSIDHPHHTCYQLFALRHGNVGLSHSKRYRKLDASTIDEKKINAATRILEKLKTIPSVREKYISTEKLCYVYIELAGIDLSNMDKKKIYHSQISFDRGSKICALKNLVHVPVPTRHLPINPDCVYDDFVYISEFLPKYSVVGGINMPKVIECRGSDGQLYKQLVKGNDDLRQDAVMEQVFTIVDHMLKKNKSTRKRNLGVRTYIVIPLSPVAGLLEWVKDTIPIGNYLQPAHATYHPEDLKYNVCRKIMMEELERKGSDAKSKFQVFSQKIIPRFKPVFRHFFHENFHDAKVWFERRLAYTRSVASTSMIGYVLGLGDRHAQNILIDKNTAELIHIDLGIAFDQGKMLKYPELVPFRLTRDIIDAMGCTGIEGVFRRCCEETLSVLRNESTALLTILEVLKYDPLYNWSLSPLKAKKIEHRDSTESQDSDPDLGAFMFQKNEEEGNKEAERAIFRVKEKLTGVEEGTSLSLSGQVAYLISSASNPELLCQLYPGWSPFL